MFRAISADGSRHVSPPTVVIVDDDDEILHVLTLLFEFEDFLVAGEATNGVDAISLARRHQPDLVVLDYRMPHMDGKATAEVLKAVSPQTQVVAFSAVLNGTPEWADAYLNKERIADIAPFLTALIPAETVNDSASVMTSNSGAQF